MRSRTLSVAVAHAALAVMLIVISGALAQETPPEPEGYWQGPMNGRVPATISGGTVIGTQKLAELLEHEPATVIDVVAAPRRPEHTSSPWRPVPHRDIPRSIWIPGAGSGVISTAMAEFIRTRVSALTAGDQEKTIVVYCRANCWASWNAAKRLIAEGYRRVIWYPDGVEGWQDAGLPTAVAEPEGPGVQ